MIINSDEILRMSPEDMAKSLLHKKIELSTNEETLISDIVTKIECATNENPDDGRHLPVYICCSRGFKVNVFDVAEIKVLNV